MPDETKRNLSPAATLVAAALEECPLYFILDEALFGQLPPEEIAETAIECGVRMIQLRVKSWKHGDLLSLAGLLKASIAGRALLIINDHADIAIRAGADGVHLGPEDMAIGDIVGLDDRLVVGASAQTPEDAVRAEIDGASYLGSGAVFKSPTKPTRKVIGHDRLGEIARSVKIPVVGIGGITAENCAAVLESGAAGFCAISPFAGSSDIAMDIREVCSAAGCG